MNNATADPLVHTLADLRTWPASAADRQSPLLLAVVGDPVAHSVSPAMQNAALATFGIAAHYTRLHIRPAELTEALSLLAPTGFLGVNLTIPHKVAAMPLLDVIDPHAATLGAVNTVRVDQTGRLHGFNTDGPGFEQAIEAEFGVKLSGLRVLVLGAGGGAGRALATQCALAGCPRLVLVNRTADKARALADVLRPQAAIDAEVTAVPWDPPALAAALQTVDLVVNASAVGLKSDDFSPLAAAAIPNRLLVFDTVYRADGSPTPLVAAAHTAGARSIGGRSLLLHQGALAFEHWFDRPAPLAVMRDALESGSTAPSSRL